MKKSDMITLNNTQSISYSHMGLFDTESPWTHPTVTIDSYELIYVVEGKVHLYEGDRTHCLTKGNLILLKPNVEHGGTQISHGHTCFYWLHFYADGTPVLPFFQTCTPRPHETQAFFREVMHRSRNQPLKCELMLADFLLSLTEERECKNKLAYEVDEYVRINARNALRVTDLTARFGYSADYLSRIYKKEFGTNLCAGIAAHRLSYIRSLLLNTNDSIKEIALSCGFEEENQFIKFFKYYEKTSPTAFRNRFYYVHMNNG